MQSQQTDVALYEATAQLAQTITALEKRSKELDEFAYITSHDLKAPLRAIANLSQWIEEDIAHQLNAENLHQLQLLRGRVYRLETLIEGLLQYSRAGRLKSEPQIVDVGLLLKQVIDTLSPPAQFMITIAPGMPTLITQRLPLEQVFTQLIDNAIKHHPLVDGTVKIGVQEQSDAYEFTVVDDGLGIAPQFHERVFGIFQTLHAKDSLESAGLGLAIAKRIVEGKGGTIRLESQEGQGATFYFTWPKMLC
jgi:light-regulated signal transduction histidine kinase (bacteriophytochrome)